MSVNGSFLSSQMVRNRASVRGGWSRRAFVNTAVLAYLLSYWVLSGF